MLAVHSEQLHKTGYPTVHAVVLLEGTMNLTGETQPLVEQLMMVKRMQVGGSRVVSLPTWWVGYLGAVGMILLILLRRSGFPLICGGKQITPLFSHWVGKHPSFTVWELA